MEHSLGLAGAQEESLVQLQQSIAPALTPPPALARVLQRIAAKQVGGAGRLDIKRGRQHGRAE